MKNNQAIKVLICGVSGSGKTHLAERLANFLHMCGKSVAHLNGDEVRKQFQDWDFSNDGRYRQANRMAVLANALHTDIVIVDFIAPTDLLRSLVGPDFIIYMNTTNNKSAYADTDAIFVPPSKPFLVVTNHLTPKQVESIAHKIIQHQNIYPTVAMVGRWQPWHKGHRALFERAIAKTGRVCIMVRDTHHPDDPANPYTFHEVVDFIHNDLYESYSGKYEIMLIPNVVNFTYGRDVGYVFEEEVLPDDIQAISATKIRAEQALANSTALPNHPTV